MSELVRELPVLVLGLLGGVVLAAAFFGGLWLTVSRLASGKGGVLLVPASLLLRMALLAFGLLLAARAGAVALLSCVVGLLLARAVAVRLARVPSRHLSVAEKEQRS